MPRPPKRRRISFLPHRTYFKPAGVPLKKLKEVSIEVEELEAIRLKDLEGLDQETCAHEMQISRATFHRIINSARHKLAEALVKGKAIRLDNSNIMEILNCDHCKKEINLTEEARDHHMEICPRSMKIKCPHCGHKVTTQL